MAPPDDAAERNSSTILARFIMYINSIISPTAASKRVKNRITTHAATTVKVFAVWFYNDDDNNNNINNTWREGSRICMHHHLWSLYMNDD